MHLPPLLDPDQWLKGNLGLKIKIIFALSTLGTLYWVSTTSWPWLTILAVFYASVLFLRTSTEVGYHRYFTHKSFQTTKFKHYFLLFIGTITGIGSCISWVGVHRVHHAYSDTAKDPHSPWNIGIVRVWLTLWGDNWQVPVGVVKDLLRDPAQKTLHKHYFKFLFSWISLWIIASILAGTVTPLILAFMLPNCLAILLTGSNNAFAHKWGYRTYDTPDNSTNIHTTRWMLISAGLHNNHHAHPNLAYLNIHKNWYEFDIEGMIIKYFFEAKNK
jgi:stearoyl-CoA desaturase (delta-9 desaturase)